MERLHGPSSPMNPFAAFIALAATVAAGVLALVMALAVAASVVVLGVIGAVLAAFAGLAFGARRRLRPAPVRRDDDVIEARKVGQSWVAYGWDRQGR